MLWTEKEVKSSPVSRSSHGVSIVGDTVYMFGGEHEARTPVANDLHSLDLSQATLEWRKVAVTGDVPSARFGHGQCSVGPFLYVFGGRQGLGRRPNNQFNCCGPNVPGKWRESYVTPTKQTRRWCISIK